MSERGEGTVGKDVDYVCEGFGCGDKLGRSPSDSKVHWSPRKRWTNRTTGEFEFYNYSLV